MRVTGPVLDSTMYDEQGTLNRQDFDHSEELGAPQSDEGGDFVRQMVRFLNQAIIDAEATEMV